MPYGRLTKYQLSARVRALRAEHHHLAGRAGSLPRIREIRGELTKSLPLKALNVRRRCCLVLWR